MRSFSLGFNTSYRLRYYDYVLLVIFIFIGFCFGLGSYALGNMSEGLYAEVAKEMLKTGSYLIPSLNFVPYIEKPPLLYWLVSFSYHLFGVSAFSVRLISALSAVILCLSLLYFCRQIRRDREGWLAAIILATSMGFILAARTLTFDMLLTVFLTLSLLYFYLWHQKRNRHYVWLFYLFSSLAFLTKGLLPLLIISIIVFVFILLEGRWWRLIQLLDWIGISLFLLITLPWHVFAVLHHPNFLRDYFVNMQFMQVHMGSFYFCVPLIFAYLFPWSLLLPTLFFGLKNAEKQLQLFLWTWFWSVLIFFSFSQARTDYYLVIAIPPLVLLLALKINNYIQQKNKVLLSFFILLVTALTACLSALYSGHFSNTIAGLLPKKWLVKEYQAIFDLLMIVGIYGILGIIAAYCFRRAIALHFLLVAGLVIPLLCFFIYERQLNQMTHSSIALVDHIKKHGPHRVIFFYQDYEKFSVLPFYLNERIGMIDNQSQDLLYGMNSQKARNWFVNLDVFKERMLTSPKPIYVLMQDSKVSKFKSSVAPLEFYEVDKRGGIVLLSNVVDEYHWGK